MPNSRRILLISLVLVAGSAVAAPPAKPVSLADRVDPMVGVVGAGSCVPGPCLPNASIYPSPDTLDGHTGGYKPGHAIVGFSQLHTQGTGGTPSYGNLLISPQIGLQTEEAEHASPGAEEVARCDYYKTRLTRYNIVCEVAPARHSALYRFTFPAADNAYLALDVARKLGKTMAVADASVTIDPDTGTIRGSGTYSGNWNPAPYRLFYCAKLSRKPTACGTWTTAVHEGTAKTAVEKGRLGAFARFKTSAQEVISLKIAVSFRSAEQAAAWLEQEIPGWDFDGLRARAADTWNEALHTATLEGASEPELRKFYSSLYHTMVQPRDRTGDNGNWDSTAPFWDDHYTLWDSWKTLFPLMAIIRPDVVRGNVNSFIDRHRHNGYVATAFIQGKEYKVGQGGDEVDNIIADAFVKGIDGVNWEDAYALLRFHADQNRTKNYREHGYVSIEARDDYCGRMKSGSGTLAFAYNDFCVAQVAKGLGKTKDYQRYLERSRDWRNVWDPTAADSGYSGFICARHADGRFAPTPPRKGFNTDFYEGSCWVYSYVVPHDVPGLVAMMGGPQKFIDRLSFALRNDLIDFTNEPSFMTIWLFDQVQRPYLASYWANVLRQKFDDRGYPGDEDDGAMSSLYVFLTAGLFPFTGQDIYYLHGPSVPKLTFQPPHGKRFTILGTNVSPTNIFVQAATLNGKALDHPWIHHKDIVAGGVLEFTMGPQPSAWGCGAEFDRATATREVAATPATNANQ